MVRLRLSIKIKPEVVDPEDVDMLQDLVLVCGSMMCGKEPGYG